MVLVRHSHMRSKHCEETSLSRIITSWPEQAFPAALTEHVICHPKAHHSDDHSTIRTHNGGNTGHLQSRVPMPAPCWDLEVRKPLHFHCFYVRAGLRTISHADCNAHGTTAIANAGLYTAKTATKPPNTEVPEAGPGASIWKVLRGLADTPRNPTAVRLAANSPRPTATARSDAPWPCAAASSGHHATAPLAARGHPPSPIQW